MSIDKLAAKLAAQRFVLGDGPMGSMRRGLGKLSPELLNVTQPNTILEIMRAYVDAGSEVISTNSFGGNAGRLSRSGGGGSIGLNRAAAQLARQVVDGLIAWSPVQWDRRGSCWSRMAC